MFVKEKVRWLVLLVVAFALALAACGGDDEGGGGTTQAGGGDEKLKVGLVTDIGGLNDRGFNELANQGLEDAKSKLGVEGRVLESKSDADYIPNLSTLADEGVGLIITNGFLMGEATHQAAEEFPDTNFAIIDFAYGGEGCEKTNSCELPNLQGLVFKEQEVGYLAGYLAAKMTKSGTISTVGGQKIPPVDRFIAGFEKGAKDANPKVKLLSGYSQEFVDPAPCKELALEQIAKGSDIVFQVAGQCGLGALDAAKEKQVWGIGVDKDQSFLGAHVLTSAVKRVEVAVYSTIEAASKGQFEGGGVSVFSLENDGVGLGKVSDQVPQELIAEVDKQKQAIIAGQIQIPETVK